MYCPIFLLAAWYVVTPRMTVHLNDSAATDIRYRWNVNNRIFRGAFGAGGRVTEPAELLSGQRFYMVFEWWINPDDVGECVMVIPKWYGTDIYLDANGKLDQSPESGTDLDRVMHCTNRPEENIACTPC